MADLCITWTGGRLIPGGLAGERLFLPGEVVDYLEGLRDLGVSARAVRLERDAWILVAASR
jgi:hypothetical protein